MPHLHRFYVPDAAVDAAELDLPDDEAHHAARVVRVRSGDTVALFNGAGCEWLGEVAECDKKRVTVRVRETRTVPPPARTVTLCQAVLNNDKPMEEIVRRGTELGLHRLIVFPAAHSERPAKIKDKWLRLAIESSKQCGRLWLPELIHATSLNDAVAKTDGPRLVFTADPPHVPLDQAIAQGNPSLFIGPEGDFTPGERAALEEAGAQPISLGAYTLRAEVAAVTALTLTQYRLGQLGPIS